jgi:hypothetical protein
MPLIAYFLPNIYQDTAVAQVYQSMKQQEGTNDAKLG